jgi:hypothetical protein
MSPKTTWSLILAAAVLFAFIFFVEQPARQARLQKASRKLLPGFDPVLVTNIVMRPANRLELRLERQGESWQLTKPIAYPADSNRVDALLAFLSEVEWLDRIPAQELRDQPNALTDFGLINPQTSFELRNATRAWSIRVGTNSVVGGRVYAQAEGGDAIFLVSKTLLQSASPDADFWRDRSLIDVDALSYDAIKVRTGGKSFELRRLQDGLWSARAGSLSSRADRTKIEALLDNLQGAQVRKFVLDDSRGDLDPYGLLVSAASSAVEVSFLKSSNVLFAIQVGDSPTNQADLAYVRRVGPGNIVLVPKDSVRPWQGAYTNLVDRHMISCPADRIGSIECSGEDQFVMDRGSDGGWNVRTSDDSFPADPELAGHLIDILTNVEMEVEQTVVAAFENYGLEHPALEYWIRPMSQSPGSTNLIADLQFGLNRAGRAFQRRADELSVNAVSAELYGRLPRVSWQLRDRRIWSFLSTNVVSVTSEMKGARTKFIRDPNGEWTFAPGSRGMLNAFALEETLHRLGDLKAVYWSGVGEDESDRFGVRDADQKVVLEVQNGDKTEVLTIEFGKRSPYIHPYAAVFLKGRRWYFEFPAPLYESILVDMSGSASLRPKTR